MTSAAVDGAAQLANADNVHSDRMTSHPLIIGGVPLDIVESTKERHDVWTGYKYGQSVEAFWSRVEPDPETGCWLWTGTTNKAGYGRTKTPYWHEVYAHRLAWEMLRGRPPAKDSGLELDHKCWNRACVRPDPEHVRLLTLAENRQRHDPARYKTHCPKGHPRSGDNLYVNPRTGARSCRECVRVATRRWFAEHRQEQNEKRAARRAS